MARALLRAPLHLCRINIPTASILSCRAPISRPLNPTSRRSFAVQNHPPFDDDPGEPGVKKGKEMFTTEVEGQNRTISYIRLRDRCTCPNCVDPHSQQRNFRTSDIPTEIRAKELIWKDGLLWASWENDIQGFDASHRSVYTQDQLARQVRYPRQSSVGPERMRVTWSKKSMNALQHWISYSDYMAESASFTTAMRFLAIYGLLFVKDVPDSREMVEKIATRIGPLRNSFYGATWDVRSIPKARNVAYTSQFLGFHMDLMYMNEPPAVQLLHCLHNSCDGGESLFVDTFATATHMMQRYPEEFDILTKTSLTYQYHHHDHSYSARRRVFHVKEDPMKRGQMAVAEVNYSPPFQGPGLGWTIGFPSVPLQKRQIKALGVFARLLERERNMFELKLNPGECVIFDNRRIAHARRQFNTASGERWLAGAYLDDDVVRSRFRVAQDNAPLAWKRAFGDGVILKDLADDAQLTSQYPRYSTGEIREPQSGIDGEVHTEIPSVPSWVLEENSKTEPALDENESAEDLEDESDAFNEEASDANPESEVAYEAQAQEPQSQEYEQPQWDFPSSRPKQTAAAPAASDPSYEEQNTTLQEPQRVNSRGRKGPHRSVGQQVFQNLMRGWPTPTRSRRNSSKAVHEKPGRLPSRRP